MPESQARASERSRKISYEEFLELCPEAKLVEWVDGHMVMEPSPSRRHQQLAEFLIRVLGMYVEERGLDQVIAAPFQMKTSPDLPGREPDVLFVARENVRRLRKLYLNGPADLVVEVVYPESRLRDKREKLAEYEMGGVREYWIIDPEKQHADFYVLGADGRYAAQWPWISYPLPRGPAEKWLAAANRHPSANRCVADLSADQVDTRSR